MSFDEDELSKRKAQKGYDDFVKANGSKHPDNENVTILKIPEGGTVTMVFEDGEELLYGSKNNTGLDLNDVIKIKGKRND